MSKNSRLVYSTDQGRIKQASHTSNTKPTTRDNSDGIVRIRRETSGRKGKGVTTITGLMMDENSLKQIAKHLKQFCGTGGSLKNGGIEIQGDHREKIKAELESQGHTVKLAGG